ncbi:MAG: hypothetical protein WBZ24_05025 [Anaerolineales bacterium]
MSATQLGLVAVGFLVVIGILLLIYSLLIRQRTAPEDEMPESLNALKDARIDPGEKVASPMSEEIESLVQADLKSHPDLAGTQIDFATDPDDTLSIWINGVAYQEVDDIPDERIRAAVHKAVALFNKSA